MATSLIPLVRLCAVNLTLQGVKAVDQASLTLFQGQHLALLGPNGAGKSSLLRLIRGDAWPDQKNGGQILWYPPQREPGEALETETANHPDSKPGDDSPLAGRAMSALLSPSLQNMFMRQDWRLKGEQIALAGLYDDFYLYHEPTDEQRALVRAVAASLGAERLPAKSLPEYSQGQLRLILLVRALMRRPALLLLDEAADGLDAKARRKLLEALEALAATPDAPTIIMSTHRDVPTFISQYMAMEQGRVQGPYPLSALRQNSTPAAPNAPTAAPADAEQIAHAKSDAAPCPSPEAGLGISLKKVTVYIDRIKILHDIDWEIAPGENWALLGANGSGKSTLLRLLLGHEDVALGGRLTRVLDGEELVFLDEIHKKIRLVSDQLQALYSYDDNAADVVFSGFDGSIGVYREASKEEKAELERLLEWTEMSRWQERRFHSLSTGQARRILLARALAGKPRLLLLDEPFSGLDQQSRANMKALIESLAASGLQIILVSHHQNDIPPCVTRRALMSDGRLSVEV